MRLEMKTKMVRIIKKRGSAKRSQAGKSASSDQKSGNGSKADTEKESQKPAPDDSQKRESTSSTEPIASTSSKKESSSAQELLGAVKKCAGPSPSPKNVAKKSGKQIVTKKVGSSSGSAHSSSGKLCEKTNEELEQEAVEALKEAFFKSSELFAPYENLLSQLSNVTGCCLYDIVVHTERTREIVDYFEKVLERLSPYRERLLDVEIEVNMESKSFCNEFRVFDKSCVELVDCFKKTGIIFSRATHLKVGNRRFAGRKKKAFDLSFVGTEVEYTLLKKTQEILLKWVLDSKRLSVIWDSLHENIAHVCKMTDRLESCLPISIDMSPILEACRLGLKTDTKIKFGSSERQNSASKINASSSLQNSSGTKPAKDSPIPVNHVPATNFQQDSRKSSAGPCCCNEVKKSESHDVQIKPNGQESGSTKKSCLSASIPITEQRPLKGKGRDSKDETDKSTKTIDLKTSLESQSITAAVTTCRKTGLKTVEVFATSINKGALIESGFLDELKDGLMGQNSKVSYAKTRHQTKDNLEQQGCMFDELKADWLESTSDGCEDNSHDCSSCYVISGTTTKEKFLADLKEAITEAGLNNSKIAASKHSSKSLQEAVAIALAEDGEYESDQNMRPPVQEFLQECNGTNEKRKCDGIAKSSGKKTEVAVAEEDVSNGNDDCPDLPLMKDVACQTDFEYGPNDYVLLDESKPLVELCEVLLTNEDGTVDIFSEDLDEFENLVKLKLSEG